MHILHIEPLRYNATVRIALESACTVDYVDVQNQEELLAQLSKADYEVLFVKLGVSINSDVLALCPNLKYVVTPTTGLNHIDMEAMAAKGITVLSLKGETEFLKNIKSTSEHTWMLLLSVIRRLPQAFADIKQDNWQREPFLGMELNTKTLGIIGYGRLGTIVAEYGKAFGMNVLVNDTDPARMGDLAPNLTGVELDTLLQKSDVITLHIPSNEANYHFLNQEKVDKMKDGVVLVNTSRGEVLEEAALLNGLQSGKIRAAGIDVIEGDSSWDAGIPAHQPLVEYARNHENLLITPHIGGYALESIEGTRAFVAEKFLNAISK